MTENYPPAFPPADRWDETPPADASGLGPETSLGQEADPGQQTAAVAKDQAADLGHGAVQAGRHAADTAAQQASNVTAEASRQGKDLFRQAQGELLEQAGQQQQRLAGDLRAISDELSSMARQSDQPGVAADLARQAADKTQDVAQWLDSRDPGQLLNEVKSFARQRPGVFLALAAGAGLLAGRMTRGLAADAHGDSSAPPAAEALTPLPEPAVYPGEAAGPTAGSGQYLGDSPAPTAVGVAAPAGDVPPLPWPHDSASEQPGSAGAGYEEPGGTFPVGGTL
ncbi:MAG: hypothetical protein ABJB47_00970 [Actinomycetota bacterium]